MSASQQVMGTSFWKITLPDLRLLMGHPILAAKCCQCGKDIWYACAAHRGYLCNECRHVECKHSAQAVWEIVDDPAVSEGDMAEYVVQKNTIALLHFFSIPKDPRTLKMLALFENWAIWLQHGWQVYLEDAGATSSSSSSDAPPERKSDPSRLMAVPCETGYNCKGGMEAYCSACCRTVCYACLPFHVGEEGCNVLQLPDLYKAYVALRSYAGMA